MVLSQLLVRLYNTLCIITPPSGGVDVASYTHEQARLIRISYVMSRFYS